MTCFLCLYKINSTVSYAANQNKKISSIADFNIGGK